MPRTRSHRRVGLSPEERAQLEEGKQEFQAEDDAEEGAWDRRHRQPRDLRQRSGSCQFQLGSAQNYNGIWTELEQCDERAL
jgi:hypothetical protein